MKRNGNAERQSRRRRRREGGVGEGVSPSPEGRGLGREIFFIFCLAMVHFGAFWALVFFFFLFVTLSNDKVCDNGNNIKHCSCQNNYSVIA